MLSSSPMRTWPPIRMAWVFTTSWAGPIPATVQVAPAGMLFLRCTRFSIVAGMAPLSPITKSKCSGVSASPFSASSTALRIMQTSKISISGLMPRRCMSVARRVMSSGLLA